MKRFKEFLIESIERVEGLNGFVNVHKNPMPVIAGNLFNKSKYKELRSLEHSGNLYMWDAADATHAEVSDSLFGNYEYKNEKYHNSKENSIQTAHNHLQKRLKSRGIIESIEKIDPKKFLSHHEYEVMADFRQGSAHGVNSYLRGDKDYNYLEPQIPVIKNTILKYRTTEPMTVYRAINHDDPELFHKHIGKIMRMKGFQSTSTNKSIAKKIMRQNATNDDFGIHSYMLHIHLPKNTHAFDIDKEVGPYRGTYGDEEFPYGQQEVVLPHNARYKVKNIQFEKFIKKSSFGFHNVHLHYKGL